MGDRHRRGDGGIRLRGLLMGCCEIGRRVRKGTRTFGTGGTFVGGYGGGGC